MLKVMIGAILTHENELKTDVFNVLNKEGDLVEDSLVKGGRLVIIYSDDEVLRTSTIEKIEKENHGIWVTTRNTKYRIDYVGGI